MAHNNRIRLTGTWTAGSVILPAEMEEIDQELYESLNGDQGGTWAPASTIIIGGAGMRVTASLIADNFSGHINNGKVLTVDVGGLIDVNGSLFIEPDAVLEVKGLSGHPGLVKFDRYAQGTWLAGSFLTISAAAGPVAAATIDLYGLQNVRSGGLLKVLASGEIEIASSGSFVADNGSFVELAGQVVLADLFSGGSNGKLNVGFPFFGPGHIVLNGTGCDITVSAGSAIYIDGTSGFPGLLEVRNHGAIQVDSGGTMLVLGGGSVNIGSNAFLNVVGDATINVNGTSGHPAFAQWGGFGIAAFAAGAQLNLGAGSIVNCNSTGEFRGTARFVDHLHLAGTGDMVLEDGSTVLDFAVHTRHGPMVRTGDTAYDSLRVIVGSMTSAHINGLEQDVVVCPSDLTADITYTVDDISPSTLHVELTFVQGKHSGHPQGGDIHIQATSGGGLFTLKDSGDPNAAGTIVWTGGVWHLKNCTPPSSLISSGTAITIP